MILQYGKHKVERGVVFERSRSHRSDSTISNVWTRIGVLGWRKVGTQVVDDGARRIDEVEQVVVLDEIAEAAE